MAPRTGARTRTESERQDDDPFAIAQRWLEKITEYLKAHRVWIAALGAAVVGVTAFGEQIGLEPGKGLRAFALILAAIFAPVVIVALTHNLPRWLERRRRRQLVAAAVEGKLARPGFFRLEPYQADDRDAYERTDGAHEQVLRWLLGANEPLLYLTGRSGTGKSSLLQAYVLPKLREADPPRRTLVVRSFADPLAELTKELRRPGMVWAKSLPGQDDPRVLLESACRHLKDERLLVVFDQFEECIILDDGKARARTEALLRSLADRPIPGLTVLVVLRSDYIFALQEFDLPPMTGHTSWFEVGPFDRAAASAFLDRSGLRFGEELRAAVLDEASRYEENAGLIRPITLNIFGIVLSRFAGGSARGVSPGRLMIGYLKESIGEADVLEIAPAVLRPMITEAGTKRPQSEDDLVRLTGLEPGLVRGCLLRLARRGLVRQLDHERRVWEVAHDFVARLLGQLVAAVRPPVFRRLQPYLAYSALGLWLVAITAGYPAWRSVEYKLVRQEFADAGVTVTPTEGGGHALIFSRQAGARAWERLLAKLERLRPVTTLVIAGDAELPKLVLPAELSVLQRLKVTDNTNLAILELLDGMGALEELVVTDNPSLAALELPKGLGALQELVVSSNTKLEALDLPLRMPELQSLQIRNNTELEVLDLPQSLPLLQSLSVRNNTELEVLRLPDELAGLQSLVITDNPNLEALQLPESLPELRLLHVRNNAKLARLELPERLGALQELVVSDNPDLARLELSDDMASLKSLVITDNSTLSRLSGWTKARNLQAAALSGPLLSALDAAGLASMPSLEALLLPPDNDAARALATDLIELRSSKKLKPLAVHYANAGTTEWWNRWRELSVSSESSSADAGKCRGVNVEARPVHTKTLRLTPPAGGTAEATVEYIVEVGFEACETGDVRPIDDRACTYYPSGRNLYRTITIALDDGEPRSLAAKAIRLPAPEPAYSKNDCNEALQDHFFNTHEDAIGNKETWSEYMRDDEVEVLQILSRVGRVQES